MARGVAWLVIVELSLSFVSPWRRKRVHRISKTIVVKPIHSVCYAYVVHGSLTMSSRIEVLQFFIAFAALGHVSHFVIQLHEAPQTLEIMKC